MIGRVATSIVLLAVILMFMAAKEPPPGHPYSSTSHDRVLLDLDEEAIKQAYKNQVEKLFEVWMRDDTDQPRRALVGVQQARRAFIAAMGELGNRRQKLLRDNQDKQQ